MQNTPTHAARNAAALRMLSPGTQGGAVLDPGHACHIGPARLRAYLASRDGIAFTTTDVAVHMGWDEADADGYLRIMAQDRRLGELAEQAGGTWLFRLAAS